MFIQICFAFIFSTIWREVQLSYGAPFFIFWVPIRISQADESRPMTTVTQAGKSFA
jgi:hypothetical protein